MIEAGISRAKLGGWRLKAMSDEGVSFSGRTLVSKTSNVGSIPTAPASPPMRKIAKEAIFWYN